MKKTLAGATIAAVLMLAGCSSTPSQAEACKTLDAQATEVMGAFSEISADDVDGSTAALEKAKDVVEEMAAVEGPAEFEELRNSLTVAMASFITEAQAAIAGEPGDMLDVEAGVTDATSDLIAYCG
ncbi:MAG: hypothetical protein RR758_03120 [Burkholderiaceae bacterium]